jgi:hypothetical protein
MLTASFVRIGRVTPAQPCPWARFLYTPSLASWNWCSIETELTGVHDVSRQMNWTCHFWEAQNFAILDNVLYQVAGRELSRLKQQEYQAHPYQIFFQGPCRRQENSYRLLPHWLVGDFVTKLSCGMAFRKHRDLFQIIASDDPYYSKHRSVLRSMIRWTRVQTRLCREATRHGMCSPGR